MINWDRLHLLDCFAQVYESKVDRVAVSRNEMFFAFLHSA